MIDRIPYTIAELKAKYPGIKKAAADKLKESEDAEPFPIKPIPPMHVEECLELFFGIMDTASERPLTNQECFMHGQLLSVYAQAITAKALGRKDRCFVVGEDDLKKILSHNSN